jgi:membrane protease YdiL (CAAX protease family)
MADTGGNADHNDYSIDCRQKSLLELAVIAGGFSLLPLLQSILNQLDSHPVAMADPASPVALLQYLWNLVLLAFLIAHSPAPLRLGRAPWQPKSRQLLAGLALAALLLAMAGVLGRFLPSPSSAAIPFAKPQNPLGTVLMVLTIVLAVSQEELLYRVYFLERLRGLGAPALAAIGMSVCLFALGHQYQGLTGLVLALCLGSVLSLAWWRWRSYWLVWVGHLAYNLLVLAASFR